MTFRQYIHLLAESIGLHQIPIVNQATEIHNFIAEDGVHHQLVTALVRDIYKKSSCGHLDAIIDPEKTLSHLAKKRSALLGENDTDICRAHLMNQLCDFSCQILGKEKASNSNLEDIQDLAGLAEG